MFLMDWQLSDTTSMLKEAKEEMRKIKILHEHVVLRA